MKSESNTTVSNNHNQSSHSNHKNNPEMMRNNHNDNDLYSSALSFSSVESGSGSSFLSNPIKYDPTNNRNNGNQPKKILVQNQQGFYINALSNGGSQQHQGQTVNGGSPLLNKSCNHHESSGCEFIEQNGNKTQKVTV